MAGMYALDVLWQERNDIAIATHIVVIGALAVFGNTASYEGFGLKRAVALVSNAVHYQKGDFLKGFHHSYKNCE
jgi:hypothetical protein